MSGRDSPSASSVASFNDSEFSVDDGEDGGGGGVARGRRQAGGLSEAGRGTRAAGAGSSLSGSQQSSFSEGDDSASEFDGADSVMGDESEFGADEDGEEDFDEGLGAGDDAGVSGLFGDDDDDDDFMEGELAATMQTGAA